MILQVFVDFTPRSYMSVLHARILESLSPEIVSVLENKELLFHFSVCGKCATSAQTYGDG